MITNSLPSKTVTAYEMNFLVFSGTALSNSRFISFSVTKTNRSAILTLILMSLESLKSVLKIGEYPWIFPSFSWEYAHVRRLDSSCASEKY